MNQLPILQTSQRGGSLGAKDGPVSAEAGDTANLVENEFMPKIGQHVAEVAEPETFNHVSFRAVDEAGQPGVRRIEGQPKDGDDSYQPVAYHFDKRVFPDVADVQRWLSNRQIDATKLEPAKDEQYPKMTAAATDAELPKGTEIVKQPTLEPFKQTTSEGQIGNALAGRDATRHAAEQQHAATVDSLMAPGVRLDPQGPVAAALQQQQAAAGRQSQLLGGLMKNSVTQMHGFGKK